MQYVFRVHHCPYRLIQPMQLFNCDEQTCYSSEKGNAFHECRGQDHVGTNVICSLGLAGNALNSAFTDLADADAGTYGRETCTNCAITGLCYIQQSCHQRHDTWFYN
jgi:hypothetical protein